MHEQRLNVISFSSHPRLLPDMKQRIYINQKAQSITRHQLPAPALDSNFSCQFSEPRMDNNFTRGQWNKWYYGMLMPPLIMDHYARDLFLLLASTSLPFGLYDFLHSLGRAWWKKTNI